MYNHIKKIIYQYQYSISVAGKHGHRSSKDTHVTSKHAQPWDTTNHDQQTWSYN